MTLDLPAVTAALTTAPPPDADPAQLVRALTDRQAIADLQVLYARAVDDHDLDTVVGLYTSDGTLDRRGEEATGHEALRAVYTASFDSYVTMLHTPHPGVVQLHGDGTASGWSHGHAELATRSTLVMAAFRYADAFRCVGGRWLFARRAIRFMYAVPADEMASSFGPEALRMRWPRTEPSAADYPESAPTWDTHRT